MSLKTKLTTAKNNVVTFIKEDGKAIAVAVGVGTIVGLAYVVKQHSNMLETMKNTINDNAAAGNYNNQNPWYLEGGDPTKAKRVHLDDETIYSNPE